MPIGYQIDEMRRFVLCTASGTVTEQELAAHRHKLSQDASLRPDFRQLFDLTEVTRLDITQEALSSFPSSKSFGTGARRAFVTGPADDPQLSDFFLHLREGSDNEIRFFKTIPDAMQWLSVFQDSTFKSLFDVAPDAMVVANASGEIQLINQRAVSLFGYELEELIGHPVERLIPQRFASHPQLRQSYVTDPDASGMERRSNLVALTKSGREVSVDISLNSITLLGEQFFVAAVRDVTRRQSAQREERDRGRAFRELLDALPVSVVVYEQDGSSSFANQSATRLAGISATEFGDQTFYRAGTDEIYPRDHLPRYRALSGESGHVDDMEMSLKDGHRLPIEVWFRPLRRNEDGEITQAVIAGVDISERKNAEQAIYSLGLIVEQSLNELYTFDAATYRFLNVNEGARRNLGYSMAELKHLTPIDIKPDFSVASFEKLLNPVRLGEKSVLVFNTRHRRKDGSLYPVEIHLRTADYRGESAYNAFVLDRTESEAMESALRTSEERYRNLVESSTDIVWQVDINGNFTFISPSLERITGIMPETVLGTSIIAAFVGEARDQIKALVGKHLDQRIPVTNETVELLHVMGDGGQYLGEAQFSSRFGEDGEVIGLQGITRDITNRRRVEEELQKLEKLESIGVLAGGIAHDLNNFLTGIVGHISLARMDDDPTDREARLLAAEEAALKIKSLTQQLLTFAKGGAPIFRSSDLDPVLREAVGFSLSGSNVIAAVDIRESLWTVRIDEGQLRQVISNLSINALQAMPLGGTFTVTAMNGRAASAPVAGWEMPEYVRLTFQDQGAGISKADCLKIFDPFFSTKASGSGLGLATCYSIVRRHNGHITVSSEEGVGTRFDIYLPAYPGEPQITQTDQSTEMSPGTGHILVMDDDKSIRELSIAALTRLGYSVTTVSKGTEAIEVYRSSLTDGNPFSVVILDLTIPGGMGGLETVGLLREMDPQVKAICASGYSNDPAMADHAANGFSATLSKPYRITELSSVIRNLLDADRDID